jgi:hypothetical protein
MQKCRKRKRVPNRPLRYKLVSEEGFMTEENDMRASQEEPELGGEEDATDVTTFAPPRFTLNVLTRGTKDRRVADGWIQEKPCCVTIDTGEFVTVARPDIVVGLPEEA